MIMLFSYNIFEYEILQDIYAHKKKVGWEYGRSLDMFAIKGYLTTIWENLPSFT